MEELAAAVGVDATPGGGPEPDSDLFEDNDNDSIEYDGDEWGAQHGGILVEEDYINDDTHSSGDRSE